MKCMVDDGNGKTHDIANEWHNNLENLRKNSQLYESFSLNRDIFKCISKLARVWYSLALS